MRQETVQTWLELKTRVAQLKAEAMSARDAGTGMNQSTLLFRGQGSDAWPLNTSYDRTKPTIRWLESYYERVAAAKAVADSLQDETLQDLELDTALSSLANADWFPQPPPHYELLVHLRHHGFPSPLLDWSRSFYVASYFAFDQPKGDHVAVFVYQEFAGNAKSFSHDDPHLVSFGPWVRTHARHVLQQAQYTMAVQKEDARWKIAQHEQVFAQGSDSQDRLLKLVVPSTEASSAMAELDEMNINAYSLFQTQDALFATLGRRMFPSDA